MSRWNITPKYSTSCEGVRVDFLNYLGKGLRLGTLHYYLALLFQLRRGVGQDEKIVQEGEMNFGNLKRCDIIGFITLVNAQRAGDRPKGQN